MDKGPENLAIKYLEVFVLDKKSKVELIQKVLELQERDKELLDRNAKLNQAKKEFERKYQEKLLSYEKRFNELMEMKVRSDLVAAEYKRLVDLKLGNKFNANATWIDKIVFVLKEAQRPMRSSEIVEILLKNDMIFRSMRNHQKSLSPHLTKALDYGRIVGKKQNGQNGYLYSLPDEDALE